MRSENTNWVFDYGPIDDVHGRGGGELPSFDIPPPDIPPFAWPSHSLAPPPLSAEFDDCIGDPYGFKEIGSRKSMSSGSSNASGSKACREKMRRDRLNDRFLELSSVIDPERPAKTEKSIILSDAVLMITHLREEAQKLKETNDNLQGKINELKVEKNELRDEKQRLKAEKEKLEQQVKGISSCTTHPSFFPHPPPTILPPYSGPGQVHVNGKVVPFTGYPAGVSMWQFMPPTSVDISIDHVLRPPVA